MGGERVVEWEGVITERELREGSLLLRIHGRGNGNSGSDGGSAAGSPCVIYPLASFLRQQLPSLFGKGGGGGGVVKGGGGEASKK